MAIALSETSAETGNAPISDSHPVWRRLRRQVECDDHAASMAAAAVLVKKDALPSAEQEPAVPQRDREIGLGEHRSHVGRHIVRPFGRVPEQAIAVRHQPVQVGVQIAQHLGVGVLADDERSAGVGDEDVTKPGAAGGLAGHRGDGVGDFVCATPAGVDLEGFLDNHAFVLSSANRGSVPIVMSAAKVQDFQTKVTQHSDNSDGAELHSLRTVDFKAAARFALRLFPKRTRLGGSGPLL